MACFKPRPVAYLYARNPKTGNRYVRYTIPDYLSPNAFEKILIPCRNCVGCRLKYSAAWGARILHESSLYEDNSFITLTYSDDKLPADFSLNYRHFQLFVKRFRDRIYPDKIRFFMCGEYGDQFGRPHFHAIIFNYGFPDKYYWTKSPSGFKLYRSDLLEDLWSDPDDGINFGYSSIGSVSFDSASYIARYCVKKRNGAIAPEYYRKLHVDEETGEVLDVFDTQPEFSHQSVKPGIGFEWYKKYHNSDIYGNDFIRVNGANVVVPRYYDSKFKLELGNNFEEIKAKRLAKALVHADNNDCHRLLVREEVQLAKAKLLVRNLYV